MNDESELFIHPSSFIVHRSRGGVMPPPARPPLPANVKCLGAASLANDVSSEMIFPLLPKFLLSVLGGSYIYLGLIEGIADSAASLLRLATGRWSDQAGRRKGFVVAGYALAAAVRPLLALINAPWQLLALRATDRVGKGVRTAPRDALVADSTPPEYRGRAFGFHRAMDHLGAAIGPILAAGFLWLYPEHYRTLFFIASVPALLAVVFLAIALREPDVSARPDDPARGEARPFGRGFWLFLLAVGVFTLGHASDAFLLVRAGELGLATAALPLLWLVFHLVKSGGSWLLGGAVDRFGPRPLLLAGWLVHAAVYLAFGLASAAWQAWALFVPFGLYHALAEPAEKTLVAELTGDETKGLAYGWHGTVVGILTFPAGLLFGAIYQGFGALAAFAAGASLSLVAVAALLTVPGRARPSRQEAPCTSTG
jgi:MFS family permease